MSWPERGEAPVIPDYVLNPDMEMPTEEIDGYEYIGVLSIPALSLELPVMGGWSYPALRVAPCRYLGSAYSGGFVIMAHNYARHFGAIGTLEPGESVSFTDVDGNVFEYAVEETQILQPQAVDEMSSGGWDLTLFTVPQAAARESLSGVRRLDQAISGKCPPRFGQG